MGIILQEIKILSNFHLHSLEENDSYWE